MAHVPVLEEALLGNVGLAKVHTQLQILEHDLLNELLAVGVIALLRFEHIVKGVQGTRCLAWGKRGLVHN